MIKNIKLCHPVCTLDDQTILPAGTTLTEDAIDGVVSSGHSRTAETPALDRTGETQSLLSHGTVRNDIIGLMSKGPYASIFPSGPPDERDPDGRIDDTLREVLDELDGVRLPAPLLRSLDYFKYGDTYSYNHFLSVYTLTTLLARDLIQDAEERQRLSGCGPTHDIGKTCVPLSILRKETPLLRKEKRILDQHSVSGYLILCHYLGDSGHISAVIARDHHERRNGSGMPRGIELNDVLVEIIAACDVYDALISPRPYRPVSFDNRTAIEELSIMVETGSLSRDVVKALISHNRGDKPHYSEVSIPSEKRGTPPEENCYGITIDKEE